MTHETISAVRARITDETFAAFGLSKKGALRRMFGWVFYLPTNRFARMIAQADEAAAVGGLGPACRVVVDYLAVQVYTSGVENLQAGGPLMILSNHPGAYDSVAIGSQVSRPDLRIIVGEIPLYDALPNIKPHLIYVPSASDPAGRMVTLRKAIDHLQKGGSLLQFGAGTIEPDPAVQAGAVEGLSRWSSSAEIMLRKAPETHVVLAIASGVLLKRFFHHPLTRLHRHPVARRRLAEFMQVLTQLAFPHAVKAEMRLRFSPPISAAELIQQSGGGRLMPVLALHVQRLFTEHAAADGLFL